MRGGRFVLLLLGTLAVALTGCAASPAEGAPAGMMSGAPVAMVSGVIAVPRDASMSAPSFDASTSVIAIARVSAPADGWIVVRSANAPGAVLGAVMVRAGENVGVKVRLAAADSHEVRVALHVDRGVHGVLEFDPERSSLALDKPVLVDGAALEMPLSLRGWGAEAIANTALLMVEDQKAAPVLVVAYLIVPAPSWIEVRLLEKGVPTRRLGFAPRPAGEFHRVAIPLRGAKPGDSVLVTVLADRGAVGRFEPTGDNALAGADQPWVSGRVVVSGRLRLR